MANDRGIKEGILAHRGSKIHYWRLKQKNAPCLVFTHGATLDHKMFDPQIPTLASAGYSILTWDMRGHGLSKPIGANFTLKQVTDDLLFLLDSLEIRQVILIGHSFGGFVTQEFTRQHPERVKALCLIGCTDLAARPSVMMRIASKILPRLLPLFSVKNFQKRTLENLSEKESVVNYAVDTTNLLSKEEFIEIIMAGVECLGFDSGYGHGYIIPMPFLLTHGERDKANEGIFSRNGPKWAEKEPNCTYQVVPDAGHTANQDNPEVFNQILLEFLNKIK